MWFDQTIQCTLLWVALLVCIHHDYTIAANLTTTIVPLLPFQMWVEWTISSPDVLQMALVVYLEENTIAENITLDYNATVAFENVTERVEFTFTGTAQVTNDFGSMTYALLKQEQRMMLENTKELEPFLQLHYEKAIRPFNGSIALLSVHVEFPDVNDVPNPDNDSMNSGDDSIYSTAWFIAAVALAVAAGSAILVVLVVGFVTTRVHSWQARLRDWKYNLDRERHLIPPPLGLEGELATATMSSRSSPADAMDGVDMAPPSGQPLATTMADP
jgi:hypothetical protein